MDEPLASFAVLLRGYRTEADLTQEALAELAGVSWRTISDLERGLKLPRRDTLALLAAALPLSDEARATFLAAGRRPGHGIATRRALAGSSVETPREQPWAYLAHAQGDDAVVGRLRADLREHEVTVWVDEHDLLPGTPSWEQALREAIRASVAVLLIVSPHTRSSRYVADELRVAELYGRRVYPLWVEGEQWIDCVPLGWGGLQYLDARGERYHGGLIALAAALQQQQEKQRLDHAVALPPPSAGEPRNPYKGLRAFTDAEAGDFFGRDSVVEALLAALPAEASDTPRFLALVGASGSGKSSVVLAGLLPRLRAGVLDHSDRWIYLPPMVPGTRPLDALARALSHTLPTGETRAIREQLERSPDALHTLAGALAAHPEQRVVLVVDQCEELFAATVDEQERECTIELLATAATAPGGHTLVLVTLRADFYDRPLRYPALGALIDAHGIAILPPSVADLRRAIEGPAALPDVRVTFEEDLIGDLLFDLRGQAGALPLLQFTLDQLFARRDVRRLTRAAAIALGGVRGALARHAEATYAALAGEEERALARALFLRLIDPGATEQDTTRRRLALAELAFPERLQTERMLAVVDAFIAARLLVAAQAPTSPDRAAELTVEVSHEALIREWLRLGDWLREARDDIRRQHSLSADAAVWARRGRPADRLYRGSLLLEAEAWAARNLASTEELAFIHAGRAEIVQQQDEERERQARQVVLVQQAATAERHAARRLRALVGILALFLLVAAALSAVAIINAVQARQAETRAQSDQHRAAANARSASNALLALKHEQQVNRSTSLAAQAMAHMGDPADLGLLLGVEAERTADTPDARGALLAGLERAPPHLIAVLNGPMRAIGALAFSPDGRLLAVGGEDQAIRLLDVASGRAIGAPLTGPTGTVTSLAFSPDGTLLAAGSTDHTVRLWRRSGADSAWERLGAPLTGPGDVVRVVAFSPRGALLAASSWDHSIWLWDLTGRRPRGALLTAQAGDVGTMAFSPDGKLLVSASLDDSSIQLWDVAHRRPVSGPFDGQTGTVAQLAFSPDGATLATTGEDGTLRLWDVRRRALRGAPLATAIPFTGDLSGSIAFSPDGKILAVADGARTMLWNVAQRRQIGAPLIAVGMGTVYTVAFSADGALLATGSADRSVRLWDVSDDAMGDDRLGVSLRSTDAESLFSVAFSPDSATLATGGYGASAAGGVRLWDVATHRERGAPLSGDAAAIFSVAFSPNGNMLAAASGDQLVHLWDVARRREIGTLSADTGTVESLAFSPNGRLLAAGYPDGSIRLWDVATRRTVGPPLTGHRGTIYALAFSPNGTLLASGGDDATIRLWDVATHRAVGPPLRGHTNTVDTLAFSPDGTMLASGSIDHTIRLWDVALEMEQGDPLIGHTDMVWSVAFSPDGTMLASGSADGTIRLWSVPSRAPIGPPLNIGSTVTSVAFNRGGTILASGSEDGVARLWDVDPASWARRACRIAARSLSRLEWREYLGNAPYQQSCPVVS